MTKQYNEYIMTKLYNIQINNKLSLTPGRVRQMGSGRSGTFSMPGIPANSLCTQTSKVSYVIFCPTISTTLDVTYKPPIKYNFLYSTGVNIHFVLRTCNSFGERSVVLCVIFLAFMILDFLSLAE